MKVALPPSVFKEVQEKSGSSGENSSLFEMITGEVRRAGLTPLILLPEICPLKGELPAIGFKEATYILRGNFPENLPENAVPVACPGFTYQKNWDYMSFLVELFALKLTVEVLRRGKFTQAIFIASPYLIKEEKIREFLEQTCQQTVKVNHLYLLNLNGERVRSFFRPTIKAPGGRCLGLAIVERKELPIEILVRELPCWIISSPLSNNTPEGAPTGEKKLIEVGMNELKSNFVTLEDLKEGKEITDEDDRKKVWSIIRRREKENRERVPYLKKGDILIPVKRKGGSNVAVIYDELPPEPLFIPKAGLVIVRANREKLSFREVLTLSKILLAEFKKLSTGSFLSVSDLKAILIELFTDEEFSKSLKEGNEETAFKEGRRAVKEAINRYLKKKKQFEKV